jgi:hypothetical protein
MVRTGIKSNVITISNTVDRVVENALSAALVCESTHNLISETEAQILNDAKKKAAQSTLDEDEDYCEEDRELLRKFREDRQQQQEEPAKKSSCEEEKTQNAGSSDDIESGVKGLNDLKDKIRLLQVQVCNKIFF